MKKQENNKLSFDSFSDNILNNREKYIIKGGERVRSSIPDTDTD
ncbi:hypothetical protein [Aquimarina sp. 2201CG14-23]|nr:hypothetical protein [Aquimarina sp. 2201CG14-23]MDH7447672.1 hypothetical protein [Aquimarina sp. 2201CG14-23]